MFKRLRDSEFSDRADEILGATLYGVNDDKIGTVDDVIFDPEKYTARYAVIDTGGWLSSRKFLVPSDHIRGSKTKSDAFHIPLSREQIEQLPEFDEDVLSSDDRFTDYERRYRGKWTSYGFSMPESRHPTFAQFENNLRKPRTTTSMPRQVQTDTRDRNVASTAGTGTASTSLAQPVAVFGVYHERNKLERAVERLKELGFQSDDISVVFPDKNRTDRFAMEHSTKAPEGATAGGGTGLVVGGVLGWLAGIGTLAIPGVGPLLAAGPIVAALAGAGVGGAVGGLAGALIGVGMPELEAKRYEKEIREGRMMVSVRCHDARSLTSARSVLVETDARDVFQTGERLAA